jgi:hypothetical protein
MNKEDFDFVTASSIRNYILQDPICDYFQCRSSEFEKDTEPEFMKKIMEDGINYEKQVVTYLQERYTVEPVATKWEDLYDKKMYEKTLTLMKAKTPIIYQAVLVNYDKKVGGICDLLVYSPIYNQIVSENNGTFFINDKEHHYVAVDIKSSRLLLTKNGLHLQNSRNFIFYKAQLYIYNEALKSMQTNFVTNCAYILGRGWQIGQEKGTNALQKLARIDFSSEDAFIQDRAEKAVEWLRKLRRNKDTWILCPPSTPELRPNMKVESGAWQTAKQKIAQQQEEITLLYHCGFQKRAQADEQGITSWKKVHGDTVLEIKSERIKKSIQREIKVKQKKSFEILPTFFSDKTRNAMQPHTVELYLDYETFVYKKSTEIIQDVDFGKTFVYLIGCGIVRNGTWTFFSFLLESLTDEAQQKLFSDWYLSCIQPLQEANVDFQIYSWGPTEKNLYEKITLDMNLFSGGKKKTNYTDLLQVFRNESIAMTGLSGYSLKKMASAMYKGGCISTVWTTTSEIKNGADAMTKGESLFLSETFDEDVKNTILQYNEIDCKVMWEIVDYFRVHH